MVEKKKSKPHLLAWISCLKDKAYFKCVSYPKYRSGAGGNGILLAIIG